MNLNGLLLAALLIFVLIIPAAFASQNCTDCNLFSVSVITDKDEYTIGVDSQVTVTVTGRAMNNVCMSSETVDLSRIRLGSETTPTPIPLASAVPLNQPPNPDPWGTGTKTINVSELQPGTYAVNAIVTSVSNPCGWYTVSSDINYTFDNRATTYFIVKKKSTEVPEVHPIFVVLIALSVIFMLRTNRK
ncbi:MAG TPA: hypothetical protein VJH23_01555 [archaeon]|nr:hypothetical protein [archaeon]